MKKRVQILLALSLIVVAAVLTWLCWPVQATIKNEEYIIASEDIAAGQKIENKDIEVLSLPAGSLPLEYTRVASQIAGEIACIDIAQGELISINHTNDIPNGIRYPHRSAGTRLMTIELPPEMANGFWLAAGSRVDIDLISRRLDAEEPVISIENVEIAAVIAADDNSNYASQNSRSAKPLICLALDRSQAVLLAEGMTNRNVCLSVICP